MQGCSVYHFLIVRKNYDRRQHGGDRNEQRSVQKTIVSKETIIPDSLGNHVRMVRGLMIIGCSHTRRIIAIGLRPGAAGNAKQEGKGEQSKSDPRHDRSPFHELSIQPVFAIRPGWDQVRTSDACGFSPRSHAARRCGRPGASAGSSQRLVGKLAAGT